MMEVTHNIGIQNRYSCFLLMGEGEVEDVSVEQDIGIKKNKSASTAVVSGKPSQGQQTGKATAKGKSQIQSQKKSIPLYVSEAKTVAIVKEKPDTDLKSSVEKHAKGKGDNINRDQQRSERSGGTSKLDEVAKDKVRESREPVSDKREEKEENKDDTETEQVAEVEDVIDEANLMTLTEWKALQQPREKPVYNLRQPGEGEDNSKWTTMILKKDKVEENHVSEEYEHPFENEFPQRAGRSKKLDIDCLFVGLPREKGRIGERDVRNKDKNRKSFADRRKFWDNKGSAQSAPKVDDINDFPSLG